MINHTSDWDFFFTKFDDNPASISLDLSLANWEGKISFPYSFRVTIYLQGPDKNGFPTAAEAENINRMEDSIAGKISSKAIQAGRVKTNGTVMLCYYANTSLGLKEEVEQYILRNYEYSTKLDDDPDWNLYNELLYPDPYEMKGIMNRRVLMQLEQGGDKLEAKRDLDHSLYFKTKEDAENFLNTIAEHQFRNDGIDVTDDPKYPVRLSISHNEIPDWHNINSLTWYLMDKSVEHNGIYDGWGCAIVN